MEKPDGLEEAINEAKKIDALNEQKKDDHHLDIKISNNPKELDIKDDHNLDIKITEHPKDPIPKVKQPDVSQITEKPIYDYPEKLNLAEKTGDAIDKSLANLSRDYLAEGEASRSAWMRPILPLAIGFGAGVLKPVADMVGNISQAAVVTSLLSPAISLVRRVTGENAFSQFARFAKRRNEGLISKLLFGGEARVLKSLYLREDRDMRQLLRLKDQGADLKSLAVGNKTRISNLIASGFIAEMKAQMIAENNIKLSDRDSEKINRMHEAYYMAKNLFYAKIPTRGQQEKFLYYDLPALLTKKERALWAKQTAGIAGIGVLKTTVLVTMGHIFTAKNITDFAKGVGDALATVGGWKDQLIHDVFQPAADAVKSGVDQIPGKLGELKNNWDNLFKAGPVPPPSGDTPPVPPPTTTPPSGPDFSQLGHEVDKLKDRISQIPKDIQEWVNNALKSNPNFLNLWGIVRSHPDDIGKLGGGVDGKLF